MDGKTPMSWRADFIRYCLDRSDKDPHACALERAKTHLIEIWRAAQEGLDMLILERGELRITDGLRTTFRFIDGRWYEVTIKAIETKELK